VLVSAGSLDDAGVFLQEDGSALVLTVDLFTPVVDDPRDYGRIAAANAVSDVYAMGGTPTVALNVVCFPDGELPSRILGEILAGGQETLAEAGVPVVGGHSVSDRELKYGLAVVGRVDPGRVVTNAGAEPGNVLYLTKPIGIGVLTTALRDGALAGDAIARVTEIMARLNRDAADAMLAAGALAATDVTGFGLIGHATELADASGVTLVIDVARVPIVAGAVDAAASGHLPGGAAVNRDYFARSVDDRFGGDTRLVDLLYDPQTSGGLLVCVPPERGGVFESECSERSVDAARIGLAEPRGESSLVLR